MGRHLIELASEHSAARKGGAVVTLVRGVRLPTGDIEIDADGTSPSLALASESAQVSLQEVFQHSPEAQEVFQHAGVNEQKHGVPVTCLDQPAAEQSTDQVHPI